MTDSASKAAPDASQGTSLTADAWRRLRKNRMATVSLVFLVFVFVACFLLIWLLPVRPNEQNLTNTFAAPSAQHLLGTDQLGRDILARILDGGQVSLLVAIFATVMSMLIGITYGAIAGFAGGRLDAVAMRIVDVLYALPFLIIVILFKLVIEQGVGEWEESMREWVSSWGLEPGSRERWLDQVKKLGSIIPLFFAIGILGWLTMSRIVRAQVQAIKEQEFVEAVRSLGKSNAYILFRHVLPNILGPVIIYATLTIPSFILYEAGLSYLGLGIRPPNASWGILLSEGANYLETAPQLLYIPATFFVLTLMSLNFLGDGLRDALDPKSSKD